MTLIVITIFFWYITARVVAIFHKDKTVLQKGFRRSWICYVGQHLLGLKIKTSGTIFQGPALYVSNHRSLADPVIILKYIHASTVAKAEVANYPLIGPAATFTGVVYVKREKKDSRKKARNEIGDALAAGKSILVFPEGTVSGEQGTLPFRPGTFAQAVAANVPVVPIALVYKDPFYHWVNEGLFSYYFKRFGLTGPRVHLVFGKPITGDDVIGNMNAAHDFINQEIRNNS